MIQDVDVSEFARMQSSLPVVDVRSPKEYARGHIPTAVSIPVFSDDERAVVGTLYKKKSKEAAINKALEIVLPKRDGFVAEIERIAAQSNREVLVHCWRGGMRSRRFSEFLSENGFKVNLLTGGYKAYRNEIHNGFKRPWKLLVLGGMTGTGKTEILAEIKKLGHQIVCLEGIANHRGSAFGGLGQLKQPTTEQFQNNLWEAWSQQDIERPIIVEDESQAIGSVRIPDELYEVIRYCPVIALDLPLEIRAERLVVDYGSFDIEDLKSKVENIARRLGHERAAQAIDDLENGKLYEVAISTLRYYDKAYTFGLNKRDEETVDIVEIETGDAKENALVVEKWINAIAKRKWKK